MRVLVITNYFPPHYVGGAELSAYNTCCGLLRRGVDVSVLMTNARMPARREQRRVVNGLDVRESTFRPFMGRLVLLQAFDPRVYWIVHQELRRERPDLVHVHNVSGASLAPIVAARRLGVPVVVTLHDHWLLCPNNMLYRGRGVLCDPRRPATDCGACFRRQDFWGNLRGRREWFARQVEDVRLFVSPSRNLVELHIAAGYDSQRFCVVPYGIEPGSYSVPEDSLVRQCAREGGLFYTMLFTGGTVESKGIQTLMAALPVLSQYIEGFRLLIAGRSDRRQLGSVRKRYLAAVRLLGRVPFQDMRWLYATSDLVVVPSVWYENSPMTILEGLLAGTPALGSRIGGIPELVVEGETGYLFEPGAPTSLVERVLEHQACSAVERRRMRQRCVEYVHAHLSMERHLDRMQAVYQEALAR